jgi:[ribosomal protein S5]-alanine N-acetyltransferase
MVTPETRWETARLRARPLMRTDAQTLFDGYASDPEVARYMTWLPHRDPNETLRFIERCEEGWKKGTAFPWSLWSQQDARFIGVIEARVRAPAIELGYALSRSCWRRGYMSEALTFVVHWGLSQPGIFRVAATCDVENVASAGVLERVGMQREGTLRRFIVHPNLSPEPRDAFCYSIVR